MGMKKKIMAAGLAACMVATLATGITLAYFTDDDSRTNTFTAAGADGAALDIVLNETADGRQVTEDDKALTLNAATDDLANGYSYDNVLPGLAYDKHVTVTLANGSVESHLYVQLSISNYSFLHDMIDQAGIDDTRLQDFFLVNPNENLVQAKVVATKTENDVFSMVFDFGAISDPEGEDELVVEVFDGVKLPASLTGDDLELLKDHDIDLSINAYAIQENTGDTDVLDAAKTEWATEWFGTTQP